MKRLAFFSLVILFQVQPSFAGITAWNHEYMDPMWTTARPQTNPDTVLSLRAAPGEYEPAAFAVRPDESGELKLTYTAGNGSFALPGEWVEIMEIRRLDAASKLNRMFEINGPVALQGGQTSFFWVTVHLPDKIAAGTYTGQVFLEHGTDTKILILSCQVLPFSLEEDPVRGGVFMAGTDLAPGWYEDMKKHGLDSFQCFWSGTGIRIERSGNELVLDFSGTDKFMADITAAGMKGPVVFSLGNDYNLHYERKIAEAFDFPVLTGPDIGGKAVKGPEITPELDSLFVEGLRQIRRYWEEKAWPQELVILIYDEPTERLLDRHKNRYDLLKTVMPETRVYGVVMNRSSWARSMADQCEIIVSDGDFLGCAQIAQLYGKDYWVYRFPLSSVYRSREKMGCLPWRAGATGVYFWMYNYWVYDPDGCAVYPHPDDPEKLVRTTFWEGIREGMDDLRYFATAEHLISRASGEARDSAEAKLEAIRSSINPDGNMTTSSQLRQVRQGLIEIILELAPAVPKTCDFNGDGKVNIIDVISLLLLAREEPDNPALDWNGDGACSATDAIALLLDIFNGTCPETAK